jgi:hypothetical protein
MGLRSLLGKRLGTLLAAGAIATLWLFATIDDWGRDFRENHAEIRQDGSDPTLRPFESRRSTEELVEALKWAARRLGTWEYAGRAQDADTTLVSFVRRGRPFGLTSDVTLRIRDRGRWRMITGESRSRIGLGDLGQNPRNLRAILTELQAVLRNTQEGPRT